MPMLIPKLRAGETGLEKFCTQCDEWWPADGEFFHSDPTGAGGLFYMCKACYSDRYKRARTERATAKNRAARAAPMQPSALRGAPC